MSTSIQFIDGLDEELGGVSLRKRRDSNTKIVVLVFNQLKAIEKLRAYRKQISHLWLRDEEGEIRVSPTGVKFFYVGDDELSKAECTFEVHSEDIFGRVMRFLHRYADDHGFEYNAN
ncbi:MULTISPECIES: photosystem II reaction center protein Psb28 [Arthrospira]|uniref:Photosystem II reaction center Psb28 protein n=1 Tax=Limnospira platensis NIES-46 TaxID=1236695 RepID=A0A5M3T4X8_LIMPL|nr:MULTISPECIES: photosystem II reaction center protein Psb28 [Arthrospira]AMW26685.1 photosystem II reaction center protein Psb28 [Arthrospira platensis YZ]KDR56329.1 Photosystem II reaction center psb28 protein [Arthrospira platensis str. Paraca]MBD2571490.1 photosystem II reaction center protein Psb28 [Arthrospira platensis FACHB-971]MBD2667579.1 photosystem II reaction center protein Psb28 [Arthrospira platensis FACHB-439]MBD2708809.1 photosystem II reaction center protein Psb28 [Arthrospi